MTDYVVLLGPPGSGKGTQAKRLSAGLGMPHVSTGDLFRAMKEQDTLLARKVREIMARGELVPDETTLMVLEERLKEGDCQEHGAILDGVPRTVPQAEALEKMLAQMGARVAAVMLMSISEDEAVRRISGRRSCPVCQRIYHVEFDPPRVAGRCDNDGAELIQREDDQAEVVRRRYQEYQRKTAPLVDYYRQKGLLNEIDANRPIEEITPDMIAVIRQAVGG
mgnify:CR=1 FL=1